jgi:hypothetical protein
VFTKESPSIKSDIDLLKAIHEDHATMDFSSWPKGHELHFKDHPTLDSKLHKKRPFTFGSEFKPDALSKTIKITCPEKQQRMNDWLKQRGIYYSTSGFFDDKYTIVFNQDIKDMDTFYRECPKKTFTFPPNTKHQRIDNYRPDIYIGLRAKQYLFANSLDGSSSIKSKGIPKGVVKQFITMKDFEDIVDKKKSQVMVDYYTMQSKNNVMKTIKMNKKAMSTFDDKIRYDNPYDFTHFGAFRRY